MLSLGQDSGRDTPPSLPPRERDTFVTPHEETDKTWGQRLSDNQGSREGSPEDLQFRLVKVLNLFPQFTFGDFNFLKFMKNERLAQLTKR